MSLNFRERGTSAIMCKYSFVFPKKNMSFSVSTLYITTITTLHTKHDFLAPKGEKVEKAGSYNKSVFRFHTPVHFSRAGLIVLFFQMQKTMPLLFFFLHIFQFVLSSSSSEFMRPPQILSLLLLSSSFELSFLSRNTA